MTADYTIIVEDDDTAVIEVATQGPPGTGQITGLTSAPVNAFTAVALINGLLVPADPTNLAHIGRVVGVATQSTAIVGGEVSYSELGPISGGVFTPGARHYLGLNGQITTTPKAPGALWAQVLGNGMSGTTDFNINMEQPIILG